MAALRKGDRFGCAPKRARRHPTLPSPPTLLLSPYEIICFKCVFAVLGVCPVFLNAILLEMFWS